MAFDPKNRLKKLAKKAAKRKAKLVKKSLGLRMSDSLGKLILIKNASSAPLHESLMPKSLFELGMGNLIVSRKMTSNQIAAGVFLVDTYCLGVKNAFFTIVSPERYQGMLEGMHGQASFVNIHPPCARKLIEGAVAYARNLGLSPHPDYQQTKEIFGDIDANACPTSFEFGNDGKPYYMTGPNETPRRRREILDTLTKSCGEGGFHFTLVEGPL